MPPAIPNYDLGLLITFNIGLTFTGILLAIAGVWVIIRQSINSTQEITQQTREIAEMHREVAFKIRRQYGDIDRDLQELKELLGGQ
jgi:hypothetical protein